jgi:excisionase family DNA binding protein
VIVVLSEDPRDAELVAGALGLLSRHLASRGQRRLPDRLRDVIHAPAATNRQHPTQVGDQADLPEPAGMPLLWTYQEVAAQMRVSVRTVERLVSTGELAARRVGRRSLIRPTDVETYVNTLPPNRTPAA